jgi:hypothetical protein
VIVGVYECTCPDASAGDEDGVAEGEEQLSEVDVPQRVERWHLREQRQHDCDDDDEMVQLQGAIWRQARVHNLQKKDQSDRPIELGILFLYSNVFRSFTQFVPAIIVQLQSWCMPPSLTQLTNGCQTKIIWVLLRKIYQIFSEKKEIYNHMSTSEFLKIPGPYL